MKLDPTDLRYLSGDEFRTLTAVEMGSKNHEVVPVQLIAQISGLRSGGVNKCIGELAKRNLVAKVPNTRYEGYRLTYGGYDFLAMRTFAKRDTVYSVGNQIGTGKESDIYVVANEDGERSCLKIHRLGRISFRTIKSKRDYLRKGQSASWMYMSRLAAMKEYAFMKVLHENGFPVPTPVDQARHCLVMELFDAFPLRQIHDIEDPGALYSTLMDLIVRLAQAGLIHGDFNEFNILIREVPHPDDPENRTTAEPILIDFPQMVSVEHENAEYYFNRDVECIRTFFKKRFRYESKLYPRFLSSVNSTNSTSDNGEERVDENGLMRTEDEQKNKRKEFRLDVVVAASGFGKKEGEALERYMKMVQEAEEHEEAEEEDDDDDEDDEEEDGQEDELAIENGVEEATESDKSATGSLQAGLEEAKIGDTASTSGSEAYNPEDEDAEEEEEEEEDRMSDVAPPNSRKSKLKPRQYTGQGRADLQGKDVQSIVASSLERQTKSQGRKHHGKKGVTALGRAKGSKKKADPRSAIRDSGDF